MKKNTILKVSELFLKVFRVLIALFAAFLIVAGVSILVNPDNNLGLSIVDGNWYLGTNGNDSLSLIAKNRPLLFILGIVQQLVIFIFVFAILGQAQIVIGSIQKLATFAEKNIDAFRKISVYFLIIAVITAFKFLPNEVTFTIKFYPLISAAGAFILSEVFKEGNELLKEKELTI